MQDAMEAVTAASVEKCPEMLMMLMIEKASACFRKAPEIRSSSDVSCVQ